MEHPVIDHPATGRPATDHPMTDLQEKGSPGKDQQMTDRLAIGCQEKGSPEIDQPATDHLATGHQGKVPSGHSQEMMIIVPGELTGGNAPPESVNSTNAVPVHTRANVHPENARQESGHPGNAPLKNVNQKTARPKRE